MKSLLAGVKVCSAQLVFVICFLLSFVSCDNGNPVNNNNNINISGIVTDKNNTVIAGADVRLEKGGQTATTGDDGSFTLTDVSINEQFRQSLNALTKHAKSNTVFEDVIAVTKAGYLNYRKIVTNSDTSGIEIKMIVCEGTVTDADGNVYQTVKIGNQVWMTKNLTTTKYNDGSAIPLVTDSATWAFDTLGAYCFYNNTTNADSIKKYGALYNWYALDKKKPIPLGWHVPTDADWDTLKDYLIANGYNWDETTTGNKIAKSLAVQTDWTTELGPGAIGNDLISNNSSGFSALPSGSRGFGIFKDIGSGGNWWSATEGIQFGAYDRSLYYGSDSLSRDNVGKTCGFSVRLVRN